MAERRIFSESLHNNFGSTIAAVLNFVRIESMNTSESTRKQDFMDLERILENSYDTIRSLSHSLYLETSIHNFWHQIIKEKVSLFPNILIQQEIIIDYLHDQEILNSEIQDFITSSVNEILTNTLKHAQSPKISLCLILKEYELKLQFQDFGKQSIQRQNKAKGIGLKILHEKVSNFNGKIETGRKESGFFINLSIPYQKKKQENILHH